MKYKVGDRVEIKSCEKMKKEYGFTSYGTIATGANSFVCDMRKYCERVMTISKIIDGGYYMREDNGDWIWNDEMIKGLATRSKENYMDKVDLQREHKKIILKYLLQREAEIRKLWAKETKIKTKEMLDKRIKEHTFGSMSSGNA